MNTQNSIVLPIDAAAQLGFVRSQLASGASKAKLMSRKEYGEAHDLKGADLKRRHYEYLRANGVQLGAAVAGSLAGGSIIPQAVTFNPETGKGSLAFVTADKFGAAPAESKAKGPAKLSDDALLGEVMRRKLNVLPLLEKMTAVA